MANFRSRVPPQYAAEGWMSRREVKRDYGKRISLPAAGEEPPYPAMQELGPADSVWQGPSARLDDQ